MRAIVDDLGQLNEPALNGLKFDTVFKEILHEQTSTLSARELDHHLPILIRRHMSSRE